MFRVCLLFFFLLVPFSYADTIYVPGDYSTIQAAIVAASDGDTIVVSDGTYYENVSFEGRDNLTLKSVNGSSSCMIHGMAHEDNPRPVIALQSQEINPVIEGFTIKNGTGAFIPACGP